jgi:hypothetical protein
LEAEKNEIPYALKKCYRNRTTSEINMELGKASHNGVISDKVKDRSNDPYFVKKAEQAKEFLRKNGLKGLPEEHLKK